MRLWALALLGMFTASPSLARDSLGIYDHWGAFRDAQPFRCYAIAQPEAESSGAWQPFASVSWWPGKSVRGQLHVRLSRALKPGSDVTLIAGGRKWRLSVGKFDAWSPSQRHDAFILARLRSAGAMSISGVSAKGNGFADTYALRGAASAFDAAALGCAKAR